MPSFTSVNDKVTDVSTFAAIARSLTVLGAVAFTVIAEVPETPPLVAVIVAVPGPTLVSNPVLFTVATVELLDVHVTARPVSTLPLVSLRVAVSCCVVPTSWLTDAGFVVTDATGTRVGGVVVPVATFESPPKTAFRFNVPRNGTS